MPGTRIKHTGGSIGCRVEDLEAEVTKLKDALQAMEQRLEKFMQQFE